MSKYSAEQASSVTELQNALYPFLVCASLFSHASVCVCTSTVRICPACVYQIKQVTYFDYRTPHTCTHTLYEARARFVENICWLHDCMYV